MGTYCELYIADYPVYSTKGGVDPIVMTIFREGDKRVFERKVSERNRLAWGHLELEDKDEVETVYEYSNTVANIRQRLEVMGFSLRRVRDEFYKGIEEEIETLKSRIETLSDSRFRDSIEADWRAEQNLLENSKFEDWLYSFKSIIERELEPQLFRNDLPRDEQPLIRYILGPTDGGPEYHFPCEDLRYFLRAFVEVCPDNGLVTQDITDLVHAGYYEPDDAVCEIALQQLTEDYPVNEKIIILTEGSTDKVILEKSLRLLYPHLYDYFSFMDFGLSNASGGASSLVATIKAFIGSGINNRIIAIFDNDTAARAARKGLAKTAIPNNMKILEYPMLEFAKRYPTIGPSGISDLDINGLACSIELYFGVDVLTRDGRLVPVQWKGYDDSLNQYQGEILHKRELQYSFFEKHSKCSADLSLIGAMDWEPMRLVLQTIFNAFS
jgi:hypothetical protein